MELTRAEIPDVVLVRAKKHGDARGFFSETYRRSAFSELGIELDFVQDNHSFSADVGTVRGLHYQVDPSAQAKLVRVVRGAILDVAVDVREGSPTYGKHVAARIDASSWNQILVPIGFAHGFCTLEPDTEVLYKTSSYYAPALERGIAWDDPELGIAWPIAAGDAKLSARDTKWPRLREVAPSFRWSR